MTDKHKQLRDDLEAAGKGLGVLHDRDLMILSRSAVNALLADNDAKHTALELVRMSAGWQYMSDETRQIVIAALTQGEQNG